MDSDFQTELSIRVAEAQTNARIPSLTVAVGLGGVPWAVASSGYADVENRVMAAGDSSYRIGSITKTFTAALALLLADRGILLLDSPVARYLPAVPFGHLPLRMLLSHTSGLQREAPTDMWKTMRGPSGHDLREMFSRVESVAEPGQRWHYSNLGYAILGQIIESVTNQPCETLIEHTLLSPLGLNQTSWEQPANAVVGYRLDPYIEMVHREPVMDQAAVGVGGQMWSTAGDLLRWGHALAGGEPTVLPIPVVEQMQTLQVMVDTANWTRGWGLGLILERRGDHIFAGHTGAMPGFQSALTLERGSGLTVAVLANATRGIKPADLAAETLCQAIAAQPPKPVREWQAVRCPEHVQPILGRWWSEADEIVFRWEHDGLHASLAADPSASDTRFSAEGPGRFRAVEGRLQGELLEVDELPDGIEMYWATYPLTRTPR
ncbi:serine hydrolase domain-containing protein [Nocardia bhagyanarayanae]|uniref:CubicO group peptidase (Beta-lactamase class C family) n=1 Tax=Nocardia bhagyanarayanae TaxID=1215925 RepID=A0A543FG34_9NOCA|nr:serine hydrolase domain-containing protein [Nocardia bhagyanarayanae]TQM32714.1 CubicO group peptidase (beta-lactamase class C family) [Nocardia bhagyanarayanae]